jgi:hypothetical protein
MVDYYCICPQCGVGEGALDWMDNFVMRCDHCGMFADIREMDNVTIYDYSCPSCVLQILKNKGLWKERCYFPGKGVFCTDGDVQYLDDAFDSIEEATEEFDRALLAGEINPKKSYITKADGDNVEFLRGSIKTMKNRY